jgi:putative two-component system response regulator
LVKDNEPQSNIIVVDDQPANLKLMEDMLWPQGYKVRSFPRGRMALAAAAQQPPDLILLDINMPEMDGLEVCKRLKADTLLAAIPVIFLSALNETEDKMRGFQSGGVDFITKPFQFEEVQVRIETQLSLHALRTRLEKQNGELESLVQLQLREIAESQMATIFALAKLAESRDNDTGKHLERVQVLCKLLAVRLSARSKYADIIDDDYIRNIFHASPLHDIGKVAIPDSILLKPGKLTVEEFTVMKTHTTLGAQTLEFVRQKHPANTFITMGIEIARSHHEKWNGSGYPSGLVGAATPVCARIMAVADCYDAMRSKRCYKEAFSHERSADIIVLDSGQHFDPDVVSGFRDAEDAFRHVRDSMT